jgi:hypothetical protein
LIGDFGFDTGRMQAVNEAQMKESDEIVSIIVSSIKTARRSKK